ncbi:DUF397 domain-containing protein [Actinokineospora sp. 24-640]
MIEHFLTGVRWKKSSKSSGNGECVEVAYAEALAAARDSKNPNGPILVFGSADWANFLRQV